LLQIQFSNPNIATINPIFKSMFEFQITIQLIKNIVNEKNLIKVGDKHTQKLFKKQFISHKSSVGK